MEWLEGQQITEYNQINDRWAEMESDTGLFSGIKFGVDGVEFFLTGKGHLRLKNKHVLKPFWPQTEALI